MIDQKTPRIVLIVQARMGAARLPGKPLKEVLGRPLLSYQIERMQGSRLVDQLVIATTTAPQDQQIVGLCEQMNVPTFRGSETDVLERYFQAAEKFHADIIVRITADCPLIDPAVIDQAIQHFLDHYPSCDYVSNSLKRTYPRGLDVEVFSFSALKKAAKIAKLPEEREHVTLYFYEHPNQFSLANVAQSSDESHHRWTVDTPEDFQLIANLISALYPQNPVFTTADIYHQLKIHPEWFALNSHIKQKSVRS